MALGPAAEVLRLAGDEAERLRPQITAALQEALAEFVSPDGVARELLDLDRRGKGARAGLAERRVKDSGPSGATILQRTKVNSSCRSLPPEIVSASTGPTPGA